MKDTDIVKALGGHKEMVRVLNLDLETARHLEKRYTPWRYRPAIKALAKRKRVAVPTDYLEVRR